MKKTTLSIILAILLNFSLNAQKKASNSKTLPISIYTLNTFSIDYNSYSLLNKKLNLTNFKFVFVKAEDLDNNIFSIETNNIGKKPSEFIFDDYKRYQNNNLLKGFFRKHDPTRWELYQCKSNFLPPKS